MAEIVPAILTNDINDFRKKHSDLLALGQYFSKLHIDFIDGEFLPNKTVMPADLGFFKSPFTLIAHLMVYNPERYYEDIKKLGFTYVIVQYEAFDSDAHVLEAIQNGKKLGLRMGVAINPETPLHKAAKILSKVEIVQIMGVHPGAQGRKFEPGTIDKISELNALSRNVIIAVDGGMKPDIAAKCARAGAGLVIIGSGVTHATHPKQALEAFKQALETI